MQRNIIFVIIACIALIGAGQACCSSHGEEKAYDRDSLFAVVCEAMDAEPDSTLYVPGGSFMATFCRVAGSAIDDSCWRQRLITDFTTDMLDDFAGMDVTREVNTVRAAVTVDSLRQRIEEAYSTFMHRYGHMQTGQEAPQLAFTDREGHRMTLADLRGKTLIVDIWGTWCAPCIEEFPHLRALQQQLESDTTMMLMSIACDRDRHTWTKFLQRRSSELTWQQFLIEPESQQTLDSTYFVVGIPRFMVIDAQGRFVSSDCLRPSDPSFLSWLRQAL